VAFPTSKVSGEWIENIKGITAAGTAPELHRVPYYKDPREGLYQNHRNIGKFD